MPPEAPATSACKMGRELGRRSQEPPREVAAGARATAARGGGGSLRLRRLLLRSPTPRSLPSGGGAERSAVTAFCGLESWGERDLKIRATTSQILLNFQPTSKFNFQI